MKPFLGKNSNELDTAIKTCLPGDVGMGHLFFSGSFALDWSFFVYERNRFFCRASPSIGAFCANRQVWTGPKRDTLSTLSRSGYRHDFLV